jgi:hypothetical protein
MPQLTILQTEPINGKIYSFRGSPDTYVGDAASVTGISVGSPDIVGLPLYQVADLLLKGILIRISVFGGTETTRKTLRMYCTREKIETIDTATAGLVGKTVKGFTVKSVVFERDAVDYA